jgi:outer membrane protein assembly factor BamB
MKFKVQSSKLEEKQRSHASRAGSATEPRRGLVFELRTLNFNLRRVAAVAIFGLCVEGVAFAGSPKQKGDWPMWGGSTDRNMASGETGIPSTWDIKSKTNLKWTAPLGSQTYGNPVISKGKIYVGTNNHGAFRPHSKGDKGIMLCFDEKSGKMLWQATHDKLPTGQVNDWPEQGICSSPFVEGDRLYYVSNRCELVCADTEGFLDGDNDGPFSDEKWKEKEDADFVWVLDMIEELGVFPHNLATSSPVIGGDTIFLITSNGVDEGHLNLPSPDAPDFIAVDKKSGKVKWTANPCGSKTFHGQWSSPAYAVVAGKPQVVFGGGNGWCFAYNPDNGEQIWKFNMNPPDAKYVLGGRGTANEIIGTPVIYDDKVFVAVGQDPEHGEGIGHLYAIDATKTGDVTESGRIWHVGGEDFHRTMSTVAIADGLLYAADLSGFLYCFDVKTGKRHWRYDVASAVWGSPYVVDGKVMLGTEDGDLHVLTHGSELKPIGVNNMENSVYTTPVAANGTLYITNRRTLFAIQGTK